jgi:SAM-dependent methyltransferase
MLEWDDRSSLRGANEAIRRRISWCAFQNGEITESRSASTLTVRATPLRGVYADGTYLEQNPTWHEEDSPWKAAQIRLMLQKHPLQIQSVAEIGCGVGAILAELCQTLPRDVECHGFDIAPEAIAGAKQRENDQLHFHLQDLLSADAFFDLLLVMDVVEHVPDYFGFLEGCRRKARFKLYHIPLDIHVSSVIRASFVRGRISVGHIHYFTAESALATLTDTGHKIVDWFYTDGGLGLASLHPSLQRTLANVPRRLISLVSTAWAARLLGGYSLMILTE